MRARHLVTLGIGAGGIAAMAAFVGCGESTFGTCEDTATCGDDASADGTSTGDGHVGGDAMGTGDGGTHEGGGEAGEGGISCDAATAIACNGTCVDKSTDPENCGTCGHTCSGPEAGVGSGTCVSGACQVACEGEAGTTLWCASTGTCVNPTSIANCGSCGNECLGPEAGPGHPVCQPSGCAIACDSDGGDGGPTEILCSGSCVDPDDINHCGTCNPCAAPPSGNGAPTCPAGACVMTCNTGYHPTGASCNADCALTLGDDPSMDPCVVGDGYGIFVSPTGSDVAPGNGTKEHPFATLGHAMDVAETANKRVYACGTFTGEQPVVGSTRDGLSVYGGFDCTTWAYSASTKTKVAPTAAGFALQVNGLTTGVTFEDFEFDSIAATTPGGSSQAVLVNASQGVVFRRVAISAGSASVTGASGTAGTNSWNGTATAGNSASGQDGALTVSSCTCGGTGGHGGNAGTDDGHGTVTQPGGSGGGGTVGSLGTGGAGAMQGFVSVTPVVVPCGSGNNGSGGSPGVGGSGGTSAGTLSSAGWINSAGVGAAGQVGGVAQGGGGGGGATYDPGTTSPTGGAAGGGCGGCGGAGGAIGGSPGGSSIALVVVSSGVTADTCTLTAAAGGAGGQGGNGEAGQSGGAPGTPAGAGCNGGSGGSGGTGGAGGGGAGGHSIGIAYHGTAPTQTGTVTINVAATAAAGGLPGNGIAGTIASAAGLNVPTQSF